MEPPARTGKGPAQPLAPGLGDRIARAAESSGGKRRLAEAAGIRETQLYRYIREDNVPSLAVAASLAAAGNVRLEWLAYGDGAPDRGPAVAEGGPGYGVEPGWTNPLTPEGAPAPVRFRTDWLRSQGWPVDGLLLGVLPDDAMAPHLGPGDLALADSRQTSVAAAGLFLLRVGESATVRRVTIRPDGGLELGCDNPAYPATSLSPGERPGLTILGRVLWTGHRR